MCWSLMFVSSISQTCKRWKILFEVASSQGVKCDQKDPLCSSFTCHLSKFKMIVLSSLFCCVVFKWGTFILKNLQVDWQSETGHFGLNVLWVLCLAIKKNITCTRWRHRHRKLVHLGDRMTMCCWCLDICLVWFGWFRNLINYQLSLGTSPQNFRLDPLKMKVWKGKNPIELYIWIFVCPSY